MGTKIPIQTKQCCARISLRATYQSKCLDAPAATATAKGKLFEGATNNTAKQISAPTTDRVAKATAAVSAIPNPPAATAALATVAATTVYTATTVSATCTAISSITTTAW